MPKESNDPVLSQVTIDGVPFQAQAPGEPLRDLAERENADILFGCYSARCGVCRVEVIEGASHLSPMEELERDLLTQLEAGPRERLACQCQINGPVILKTQGSPL